MGHEPFLEGLATLVMGQVANALSILVPMWCLSLPQFSLQRSLVF